MSPSIWSRLDLGRRLLTLVGYSDLDPGAGTQLVDVDHNFLKISKISWLRWNRNAKVLRATSSSYFDPQLGREWQMDPHFSFLHPGLQRHVTAFVTVESDVDGDRFLSGVMKFDGERLVLWRACDGDSKDRECKTFHRFPQVCPIARLYSDTHEGVGTGAHVLWTPRPNGLRMSPAATV